MTPNLILQALSQRNNPVATNAQQPPQNSNLQTFKQWISMLKSSGNPMGMLNSMMSSNPQMQQAFQFAKMFGGNPQQAFFELAKQKGVDPNEIINLLR